MGEPETPTIRGPAFGQDGRLLTPPQVANLLQVKLRRVYDLVHSRRLRAIRVGAQLRFRPRDVDVYIERNATAE